ncbi:MAG TPA: ADOP family duplicated permease [Thermoanaerobaculia bacterium]|nr:ADOP family duplicated permease [Thermoanaerobaculia bacterium]
MRRSARDRFGGLRRGEAELEREVDDEITHHLERRAARLIAEGWSPAEAWAEARRRFGGVEAVRRACLDLQTRQDRRAIRRDLIGDLARDLGLAGRRLRREPGFALAAVVTLGLGLGALLAIAALFDAVIVRPLPYPEPDRLVAVWPEARSRAELDGVETLDSLENVAAFQDGLHLALPGPDAPLRVEAAAVTPSLFSVLATAPRSGRVLAAEDAAAVVRRAVVSERLWQRVWGADPGVVGGTIELDGRGWEVVGVMPAGFHFPHSGTEVWIPLDRDDANLGAYWGSYDLRLIGRLAEGVGIERVASELRALAPRLREANPIWTPGEDYGRDARAVPLQEQLAGADLRRLLGLLLGAVAALLLIVCVNVASLQLARAGARRQEAALRASLGAGRIRLIRQHLVESLVLAGGGALLGAAVAQLLITLLADAIEGADARFGAVGLDARLLLVAAVLAVATAIGIGGWPALHVSRAPASLQTGRGAAGRPAGAGGRRVLVCGQIALCVVLVTGAALLLLSFWNLSRVDPGFDGRTVLSAQLDPPAAAYTEAAQTLDLYDRLLERLATTPGVPAVAAASRLPLDGAQNRMAFPSSGNVLEDGLLPMAVRRVVTPGYFSTLGIPLLSGRSFDAGDDTGAPLVVIVNRRLAETTWPGRSAIGERVGMPWERPVREVVGVVENTLQDGLDAEVEPEIYLPFAQAPTARMRVLVRSAEDPHTLTALLRSSVSAIDPRVPVSDVLTVRAIAAGSISDARHLALIVASLATIALLIAAVGVFGVIAYLVEERRREIGVRVALGASRARVAGAVLGEALSLGLAGVALGLLGTAFAARAVRAFLFQASPLEPAVLLIVPSALLGMCILASWLPARRAAALDPVEALRAD